MTRLTVLLVLLLTGCVNGTGGDGALYAVVGLGPKEEILKEVRDVGTLSNADKIMAGSFAFDHTICAQARAHAEKLYVEIQVDAYGQVKSASLVTPELDHALRNNVEREATHKKFIRGLLGSAFAPYHCYLEVDNVSDRASIVAD